MKTYLLIGCCFFSLHLNAQTKKVSFIKDEAQKKVEVFVDGKSFTSFLYPDNMEKPILFPLNTASGITVTRGFPLNPRGNERTDHPHHVGLWFNYESVNGLDFWNNSYNIAAEKKSKYGWIRNVKLTNVTESNNKGTLAYTANWEKQDHTVLLKEETSFVFSGTENERFIDRYTTLTAQKEPVQFKDIKDGMLGVRVTNELELPSDKAVSYTDNNGIVTSVPSAKNGANGNYLTSAGKQGNDAWGTRANWCLLYAKKDGQAVSIAIIDHKKNPGYPTYWHARDYGLFAANPLGQAIFSEGKEQMNLTLKPGGSVTFRYRIIISSGTEISPEKLNEQANDFSSSSLPKKI